MIAGLRGTVQRVGADYAVVGAGAFDLKVAMPLTALHGLAVGATVSLHTYFYVHEDVLALYGFLTPDDLAMFELLLKVQGVGPRVALALLSALPAEELRGRLAGGDEAALTRVPGVGKRTAARLVLELKGRVGAEPAPGAGAPAGGAAQELVEALVAYGYKRPDAERVLRLPEIAAIADEGRRLGAAMSRLVQGD